LDLRPGDIVVDATFGFGGHSREILERIGPKGRIVAIEQDLEALEKGKFESDQVVFINENFEKLREILEKLKIKSVDKILFDLGISSFHFDKSGRGFTFAKDEPLDMRMSQDRGIMARDLVNGLSEKELADLIYQFGGEYDSRRIAKAIVEARRRERIISTGQLSDIIRRAKRGYSKINPATKVFQALRIAVNDEIGVLERILPVAIKRLARGGRIAVISFHSGEDRIVKQVFKRYKSGGEIEIITRKPIIPSSEEIASNPRSRSAKMRVAERK